MLKYISRNNKYNGEFKNFNFTYILILTPGVYSGLIWLSLVPMIQLVKKPVHIEILSKSLFFCYS